MSSKQTIPTVNWLEWAERWQAQQENYLAYRSERFQLMMDYIARQRGKGKLRLLDLCCGPGAISQIALQHFEEATIVAVDKDPWLLELGRQTVGKNERVTFIEADLRSDDWLQELAPGSFDAIFSATALHWFWPEELMPLYRKLAGLLTEGGIFLNADHLPVGAPGLDKLSQAAIKEWQAANFARPHSEDWEQYWTAVRAEPTFAELLAKREQAFADRKIAPSTSISFHRQALREAAFRETGEIWRYYNDAILVGLL